jgi:hypothetical protein
MAAHRLVWTRCAELIGVAYPTAVFKARELGLAGRRRGAAHRYLEAAAPPGQKVDHQ